MTYVGEKDAWNTALGMDTLLMAFLFICTASKTPLVASDRVLMGLNAALVVSLNGRAQKFIVLGKSRRLLFPAKGQVSSRDHLDKVHEVERLLIGDLVCAIKRVDVVAGPSTGAGVLVLLLHVCND
jgi:hypothetical protein